MKTMATDDLDLAARPTLDILKPPAGVDRLDWAESIILTQLGGRGPRKGLNFRDRGN